ncbi:hypothetical protein PNQ29_08590 [Halobacterium salinarum]|uniref:hypothetical protein n=1 Tax=Halobacterium salinarum TaxID=2242 RepID=UPI0025550D0C|nr:hypothetical protein [Halobacterium salinarum]MDL0118555.1 hypothetical protein [Halobacterium salinarum]MDL0119177.1 hypothetical protein [Halobacterium salinarum]MDL0119784.1 hypothetical protein [Halobacterium salinarum]
MAIQTTSLKSKVDSLEQKAEEYDRRTNTESRVDDAREDLKELNIVLRKLNGSLSDFERQAGILTEVFDQSLPSEAVSARDEVQSLTEITQDNILDVIDNSDRSLASHVEDVRDARESVNDARRIIDDRLKTIQNDKLGDASTAESIQRIVGEDSDAMKTISQYRSFLNSILDPDGSVSHLKSQWQGLEKAFDNLDTDWEGFRKRHGLSKGTITDLKKLSRQGEVDLDELSEESVTEMLEVPELRSTIKVSL